jgi:hypothetical protein
MIYILPTFLTVVFFAVYGVASAFEDVWRAVRNTRRRAR